MRVDLFDFMLPESLIALRPAEPRDSARLLVVAPDGQMSDLHVRDLASLLQAGDVVVVNDTRVMSVRLTGQRLARDAAGQGGAKVELTLLGAATVGRVQALAKPAKRLKAGDRILFGDGNAALVEARDGGEVSLYFANDDAVRATMAAFGDMPLPPYIASRRAPDRKDAADYQTMFADKDGSIAAPTAGLHFTEGLQGTLGAAGIGLEKLTLHVGRGTFLPVEADDTANHHMHAERAILSSATAAALNRVRRDGGRIVAVGTTALRTLESAVDDEGVFQSYDSETSIFITPGYRFRAVDVLLTNFHLPRSTLFMLVCAFMGMETMKSAYAKAIADGYRFYSYGDASLLLRKGRNN